MLNGADIATTAHQIRNLAFTDERSHTIPATATVVISIVAAFVALPGRTFAGAAALFLLSARFCRIQTFASLTIRELPCVTTFSTTVATVPVAAAVIVFIVASLVADETLGTAVTALWTSGLLLGWVQAFALGTVLVLTLVATCSAAIAFIPIARAVVVRVVASTVANP